MPLSQIMQGPRFHHMYCKNIGWRECLMGEGKIAEVGLEERRNRAWATEEGKVGGGSREAESSSRYNGSHSSLWQPSKCSTGEDTTLRHLKCNKIQRAHPYFAYIHKWKYSFISACMVLCSSTRVLALGQWYVKGHCTSVHTPLHSTYTSTAATGISKAHICSGLLRHQIYTYTHLLIW